jgi:hypothetical protein
MSVEPSAGAAALAPPFDSTRPTRQHGGLSS